MTVYTNIRVSLTLCAMLVVLDACGMRSGLQRPDSEKRQSSEFDHSSAGSFFGFTSVGAGSVTIDTPPPSATPTQEHAPAPQTEPSTQDSEAKDPKAADSRELTP